MSDASPVPIDTVPPLGAIRPSNVRYSRALRSAGALVLREMTTTYGRSPGGFLWAVAEPVAAIALLSFAFSLVFVAPPLGRDFALFYATGFLPFFLFLEVSQKVAAALTFSRPLLGFAAVTWVDAILGRFTLSILAHAVVATLVLTALMGMADGVPNPQPGLLALAFMMAALLALGVGTLNAYVTGAFPVWERLWAIVMRPMFIVSGVIFLFEDVPLALQKWLVWNPLFHITGMVRQAFYPSYHPEYVSPVFVFAVSLFLLLVGGCLLHRFHEEIIRK